MGIELEVLEYELRVDAQINLNASMFWMLYYECHNVMNYIQGTEILLPLKVDPDL